VMEISSGAQDPSPDAHADVPDRFYVLVENFVKVLLNLGPSWLQTSNAKLFLNPIAIVRCELILFSSLSLTLLSFSL
jgi:hypothetical protein